MPTRPRLAVARVFERTMPSFNTVNELAEIVQLHSRPVIAFSDVVKLRSLCSWLMVKDQRANAPARAPNTVFGASTRQRAEYCIRRVNAPTRQRASGPNTGFGASTRQRASAPNTGFGALARWSFTINQEHRLQTSTASLNVIYRSGVKLNYLR